MTCLRVYGREFHVFGPITEKALIPTVLREERETTNNSFSSLIQLMQQQIIQWLYSRNEIDKCVTIADLPSSFAAEPRNEVWLADATLKNKVLGKERKCCHQYQNRSTHKVIQISKS